MNRRDSLQQLGALALFANPLVSGAAAVFNPKKPIKQFGKVYDYLLDHELRTEEMRDGIIQVVDADFSDEQFINGTWKNFHFKKCYIPASHFIQQTETLGCMFMSCEFGPGRLDSASVHRQASLFG